MSEKIVVNGVPMMTTKEMEERIKANKEKQEPPAEKKTTAKKKH
jgi:hypothetical protein